jgi:hypothetical protein
MINKKTWADNVTMNTALANIFLEALSLQVRASFLQWHLCEPNIVFVNMFMWFVDTSLEVSSGVFNAVHSNKFEVPDNFKQLIWNKARPSPGSMIIPLGLLKDELEADQAGLPTEFNRWPTKLLEFLVQEAGEDRNNQINYIKQIMVELEQLGQTNLRNKALSPDKGIGQSNASKTQGTLPGAHKASPTEEAAIELATMAGPDKEGVQSLSMATPG